MAGEDAEWLYREVTFEEYMVEHSALAMPDIPLMAVELGVAAWIAQWKADYPDIDWSPRPRNAWKLILDLEMIE